MFGGLLPPVIFEVTANVGEALAKFGAVNGELKKMEVQAAKTGKGLTSFQKTTTVATAAVKALTLATAAFVAYGVHEIGQVEKAYNSLGLALANAGQSSDENRKRFEELSHSFEQLGFDAANTANALSILVTGTQSAAQSEKLLAVAADLARAKTISLEEASSLLIRASQGNARVFKQFGITMDATLPKAKAFEKALGELEQRIGGRAQAYTKTFQGQLEVLGRQIQSFAESIGATVLPYLTKFIEKIREASKWVKEHKGILNTLAVFITSVLIVAVVNLTKKLYAQAIAWAAANWEITLVIAAVIAAAAAFVYFWNSQENVRKALIGLGKVFLGFGKVVAALMGGLVIIFTEFTKVVALAQIGIGKLFHNKEMVKRGEETIATMDKIKNKVDGYVRNFDTWSKSLDSLVDKKIDVSKWKLPKLEIPKFEGGTPGDVIAEDIAKGVAKAQQSIKDFNDNLKIEFAKFKDTWSSIISRDFEKDIQAKIGDPIDQIIYDAQASIDSYAAASSRYAAVTKDLGKAQDAYVAALKTGNEQLILGAESALKKAEDAVTGVYDEMGAALKDIAKFQEEMITKVAEMYSAITELETTRTKTLKEAQKERVALEKSYNDEVARLRKDYDSSTLRAEQEAAKRRADLVKQSVDQLRNAFKNATYRSIGDIYQALTFEGRYIKGGTTEKILKALGLQTDKAKTLAADAATLAGMGFSQTFIEEVVAQGPDVGHKLAQTIIRSTPESVRQMQDYWNELQKTSTHGVDNVAQTLNVGMKLATEDMMAQLAQVDIDLKAQLLEADAILQEGLKQAFLSYSASLDDINNRTAEQIAEIDKQIAQLNAKIAMMKSALAAMGTIAAPGVSAPAPSIIPQTETSEEEGVATSCESGRGKFKVIKFNGIEMSRTLISCIAPTTPPVIPPTTDDAQKALDEANAAAADADAAYQESLLALYKSSSIRNQYAERASSAGVGFTQTEIDELTLIKRGAGSRSVTVNITANTNATAQDIANATGWAIRTSGDVQYRAPRGAMPEDRVAL